MSWRVITYRLPAEPSRHRVAVWRELRRLGDADSAAGDDTGEAGQESSYSNWRARRAALDAISGGAVVDEPGGEW